MAKKLFTDEEIIDLKNNSFTFSVSKHYLYLTIEAKLTFFNEYKDGVPIKTILMNHGYSPEVLGNNRIDGILKMLKAQSKRESGFTEGHVEKYTVSNGAKLTLEQKVAKLENELLLMKDQMEFLKKILSAKNSI